MKKQSRLFWADVSLLIAAAIKLWRQLFSARRKSKNKEIIAENIICCRQYFSASWRARKISRPLGAEELINCGFYFGPYFFSFLCFSFGPKSKADFSIHKYFALYFYYGPKPKQQKKKKNGP